jgi:hypothetical protein
MSRCSGPESRKKLGRSIGRKMATGDRKEKKQEL